MLRMMMVLAAMALAGPGAAQTATGQVAAVRAAIAPYQDRALARAEGWRPIGGDEPLMGRHWYHPEGPDYVGNPRLDPTRPSNLMYTEIGGRQVLTGAAFVVRIGPGEPLPEGFAGRADRWHVHHVGDFVEAATQDRPFLGWLANGWLEREYPGDARDRLAMVHVWAIPNPDGPFASHNRTLPYLKLGLPASHAEGADMAAARGLSLAAPGGCANAIDGRAWVANLPRATAAALHDACGQMARYVRDHLGGTKAQINAAGEKAWAAYGAFEAERLTPAQKSRIAAISEHGDMGGH